MKLKLILTLGLVFALSASVFAGATNYPDGIKVNGIPVLGSGDLTTTGKVFFVSSATGAAGFNGENSDQPMATIDQAINKTTAGRGDIIIIKAGHTETITTGSLTVDVSGLHIVGLGKGGLLPILTVGTTGTGTNIDITAANVNLENIRFVVGIDGLDSVLDVAVGADDLTIKNCQFIGSSSAQADDFIIVTNNVDNLSLIGNKVRQTTTGGESFLELGSPSSVFNGESEDTYIGYNSIVGDFSVAAIDNLVTANDVLIEYNDVDNLSTNDIGITLNVLTDGTVRYNTVRIVADGTFITTANADVQLYENYGVNADGETGRLIGAVSH